MSDKDIKGITEYCQKNMIKGKKGEAHSLS